MKCIYCKKQVGFMKVVHEECEYMMSNMFNKMKIIFDMKVAGEISAKEARIKAGELSLSNSLYHDFMEKAIIDKTVIHMNEVIIYSDMSFTVSESKNRCKMVETGYRYEKMPTWSEKNFLLDRNGYVYLTDQAIYLYVGGKTMRYPYNKLVNCGYEKLWSVHCAYFDVKTSSPYPHRFTLSDSFKNKNGEKEQRLTEFLQGLI